MRNFSNLFPADFLTSWFVNTKDRIIKEVKLTIDKMSVCKHDLKHRVGVQSVPVGTAYVRV